MLEVDFVARASFLYIGTGKGDVTKDTSSRSRSKGRPEMKRVSSEGKPLAYDDPGKDNYANYSKAKTHVSDELTCVMTLYQGGDWK